MGCNCGKNKSASATKTATVKNPDGSTRTFTGRNAESEARLAAAKSGGKLVKSAK